MQLYYYISIILYRNPPIWIEFLRLPPVLGIMMQCIEGKDNLCSLGDCGAIAKGSGSSAHTVDAT